MFYITLSCTFEDINRELRKMFKEYDDARDGFEGIRGSAIGSYIIVETITRIAPQKWEIGLKVQEDK